MKCSIALIVAAAAAPHCQPALRDGGDIIIGGDIVAPEYGLGRIRIDEPDIVGDWDVEAARKAAKKANRQANKELILYLIRHKNPRTKSSGSVVP